MSKERKALAWEAENEEVRRLFTLTPDDLYFLRPIRADAQRLYRAFVLLWARVERVLLSETNSIPEVVIKQVSKQLPLLCGLGKSRPMVGISPEPCELRFLLFDGLKTRQNPEATK